MLGVGFRGRVGDSISKRSVAGGEGIEDWDAAAAAEAMSRALVASGDLAGAATWKAKAEALLEGVADPDDRGVVEGDLATLPV